MTNHGARRTDPEAAPQPETDMTSLPQSHEPMVSSKQAPSEGTSWESASSEGTSWESASSEGASWESASSGVVAADAVAGNSEANKSHVKIGEAQMGAVQMGDVKIGDADDAAAKDNTSEDPRDYLPEFMKRFGRTDWILWWVFTLSGIYGLAIIPFRAVLLFNHTFVYTLLTGSSLSVIKLAAENPDRPLFLAVVVIVATLSAVKFIPLFYLIGSRWGQEFLDYQFMGHPPLWYRKLENLIYRHIGLFLFLAYLPFSPLPTPILVMVAGIRRRSPTLIAAYILCFAGALKSFYLYLGLRYGTSVQETLTVIDRYVTWITLGLLVYLFATIWWKQRRKAQASPTRADA